MAMMANPIEAREGELTLDAFVRLFDTEGPFELINGERIAKLPPISEHNEIAKLLYDLLLGYQKSAGVVVHREAAYALVYDSHWVKGSRIPDLMLYMADRMEAYKAADQAWRAKPYLIVPDLCIEVTSPNDHYADVEAKTLRYLEDGVRLVWVLNPPTRSVMVYRSNGEIERLSGDATLSGEAFVQGMTVAVNALFV
jgi:Uma2 family endonuclease